MDAWEIKINITPLHHTFHFEQTAITLAPQRNAKQTQINTQQHHATRKQTINSKLSRLHYMQIYQIL
jgi:hypothetical protein